jgi:aspartate carbamoyltransferase catalytic subunit
VRHVLGIDDLGHERSSAILALVPRMAEVRSRSVPKVAALRGRTVAMLFLEDSTRTRLSFDAAARALSADTMTFTASTSSMKKGESLRDTVETISALGPHALVVRHRTSGAPWQVSAWTGATVVNAGDGSHEHPTQALLDVHTIRESFGTESLRGVRVGIVGDIRHSRVARSNVRLLRMLGASVVLIAPSPLQPVGVAGWGVDASTSLDEVLADLDVLYLLRVQAERIGRALPDPGEYARRFGLDEARVRRLRRGAIVMHPGPVNHGVESSVDLARLPQSVVARQVANGVPVRMAVLLDALAGAGAGMEDA